MRYHAPTKQFTVSVGALDDAANSMRYAIKKIRDCAGFPLEGGRREGPMTHACHAEKAILDAGIALGIDLGATRPGELSVRDAG